MLKASVIIPNYNGKRFLEGCMNALSLQNDQRFDTVVIDNGSGKEDVEWLSNWVKKDPERNILIRNKENLGFPKAVNEGIEYAFSMGRPYVILLNNDTCVYPDFVGSLISSMETGILKKSVFDPMNKTSGRSVNVLSGTSADTGINSSADTVSDSLQVPPEKLFALSSRMVKLYDPSIMDNAGDQLTILGWQFSRGLEEKSFKNYDDPKKILSACAGASIYSSSLLKKTGLFDTAHFAYLEDIDISLRARFSGYEICYCPEAVCRHYGSGTTGSKYNSFKVKISARNSIYVLHKNFPMILLVLNFLPLVLGFLIKYLFFLKKGFGKDYLSGLMEGLKERKKLQRKTDFGLIISLKMELKMILATIEYMFRILKKFLL